MSKQPYKKPYYKPKADAEPEPTFAQPFFVDIETVPAFSTFEQLPEPMQKLFLWRFKLELHEAKAVEVIGSYKSDIIPVNDDLINSVYIKRAPFSAEFGKIVNISLGKVVLSESGAINLRIKSLYGHDEKEILREFVRIVMKAKSMCAHNGKEFDYPFIFRRLVIHRITVPYLMNAIGKKPYEMNGLEDTMLMWSGTQWNHKVSLDLLATIFGVPTSKQEMGGEDVYRVYYHEEDGLQKISQYGAGDIFTMTNVYSIMRGFNPILPEQIILA